MHPSYFETRFTHEGGPVDWPPSFAIITAYATTGETWTRTENESADAALRERLRKLDALICRVTGYSPSTGHAEPGWAASLTLDMAVELGREFRQDAIYFVRDDALFVTRCESPALVRVGSFRSRLS